MNRFPLPMLAGKAIGDALAYPLMASPKIDGVRARIVNGMVMSRSMKPLPNFYVQQVFGVALLEGLDGELTAGPACAPDVYRKTSSLVMSDQGAGLVTFHVFDDMHNIPANPHLHFEDRYVSAQRRVGRISAMWEGQQELISMVPHRRISNEAELLAYERDCLALGYEGIMLRALNGRYKGGRSTFKEGLLLKLKRFEDSEAVIIDFAEQMHNANEAEVNELGRTKRSSKKVGKLPMGTLGALLCRDLKTGVEFDIGTGFSAELRQEIWDDRVLWLGAIVKYRFFPIGVKDKPRHPVFIARRDRRDM